MIVSLTNEMMSGGNVSITNTDNSNSEATDYKNLAKRTNDEIKETEQELLFEKSNAISKMDLSEIYDLLSGTYSDDISKMDLSEIYDLLSNRYSDDISKMEQFELQDPVNAFEMGSEEAEAYAIECATPKYNNVG